MVGKTLPYYYIITLWVVALVSVFLIVKPLIINSSNEDNLFSDISNDAGGHSSDKQAQNNSKGFTTNTKLKDDSNDLIFYDKTAFIRYFSDKFSPEELSTTYNEAVGTNGGAMNKGSIKVVRKGNVAKSPKSFSGSFDIKPLPGLSKK